MTRVFLTGASSGIGLATAQALVRQGDQVWGTSRDTSRIPKLPGLHPIRLDLSDSNSINEGFSKALSEAGYFDVIINNAGSGYFGPAEDLSAGQIKEEFQVLVFGHLQLIRLALQAMRSQKHGLIINVTSLASRLPVPFMAAYNAAKAAMAAFSMSMQLELSGSNVRLVDLQPADICTAFNDVVKKAARPNPFYESKVTKTWSAVDRNMKAAPKPELVAKHIVRLLNMSSPPPRITVGDAFQSRIAPLIFRFLPQRIRLWGLRQYYGI